LTEAVKRSAFFCNPERREAAEKSISTMRQHALSLFFPEGDRGDMNLSLLLEISEKS